jgi:hypothetical protein
METIPVLSQSPGAKVSIAVTFTKYFLPRHCGKLNQCKWAYQKKLPNAKQYLQIGQSDRKNLNFQQKNSFKKYFGIKLGVALKIKSIDINSFHFIKQRVK